MIQHSHCIFTIILYIQVARLKAADVYVEKSILRKVSVPGLSAAPLSAVKCPSDVFFLGTVSVTEALLLIEENILQNNMRLGSLIAHCGAVLPMYNTRRCTKTD